LLSCHSSLFKLTHVVNTRYFLSYLSRSMNAFASTATISIFGWFLKQEIRRTFAALQHRQRNEMNRNGTDFDVPFRNGTETKQEFCDVGPERNRTEIKIISFSSPAEITSEWDASRQIQVFKDPLVLIVPNIELPVSSITFAILEPDDVLMIRLNQINHTCSLYQSITQNG
jgi:hypothetical protein